MKKMKRILTIALSCLALSFTAHAKKVKFAVDMQNETISPAGVFIVGDFQEVAGLGTNFATLTPLTQEGSTSIYSIVVTIPAFQKYEYKFSNGDLFYEVEFVPVISRVGYDFNDNRWLYVDSTANDTTYIGAILYGGNAPEGMHAARLMVNMAEQTVSPNGVHIGGTFNNWGETKAQIVSLMSNSIFEGIIFIPQGSTHEYRFFNGTQTEVIQGNCTTNSSRVLTITDDTAFDQICFGLCTDCSVGFQEINLSLGLTSSPNPSSDRITVAWSNNADFDSATLFDLSGKSVGNYQLTTDNKLEISKDNLQDGMYFLSLTGTNSLTIKLQFKP